VPERALFGSWMLMLAVTYSTHRTRTVSLRSRHELM